MREYFADQIQRSIPAAWQQANERLYQHFKCTAKEYPDTLTEMPPLCRPG